MVTFDNLSGLPDESHVWLYVASRVLTDAEVQDVNSRLAQFFAQWESHGRSVVGAADIAENRLVAVAAHVPGGDISGCGIDKSVHVLDAAGAELGLKWLSGLNIAWRDKEAALVVDTRPAFRQSIASGSVDGATRVVDLSPSSLGALRSRGIERPASQSWHAQVFGIPTPVDAG